jgi:hypothetical protein
MTSGIKFTAVFFLLTMAACHAAPPDSQRNFADPAIGEALSEPLTTDVDLHSSSNPDALGPHDQPATQMISPDVIIDTTGAPTLGQIATSRVADAGFTGCKTAIGYSAQWSLRLPAWLELPDKAHLVEAAGSDAPHCALRIIRFGMEGTPAATLTLYAEVAKRAGFTARPEKTSLTAARGKDGAAFRVDVVAIPTGTRVDLISNRGA